MKGLSVNQLFGISIALYLVVFWSSFSKLIDIWLASNTYGHGFLIPIFSAWLIYQRREELSLLPSQKFNLGYFGLIGTSFLWFLAQLSGINVVEQFCVLLMPTFIVWAIWGYNGVQRLLFPLLFLLFAIPVGDFLIPYLQFITADISVFLLELLRIPVYRDGMYIQIPNGNFLVAEACSGIRFLISTFTIGVLYAYLNMKSAIRRSVFILLSILVPIIANGLRAFLMILIGYLSDMQAAVGFDHLVYGWLFFAIVMVLLFVIGHYMSDEQAVSNAESNNKHTEEVKGDIKSHKHISIFAGLWLLVSLGFGSCLNYAYENQVSGVVKSNTLDAKVSERSYTSWQPDYPNVDEVSFSKLSGVEVFRFVFNYEDERQNKELISSQNQLFDQSAWSLEGIKSGQLNIAEDRVIPYVELRLASLSSKDRILRISYQVGDNFYASKLKVKLAQLYGKVTFSDIGGKSHVFTTLDENDSERRLNEVMLQSLR